MLLTLAIEGISDLILFYFIRSLLENTDGAEKRLLNSFIFFYGVAENVLDVLRLLKS